MTFNQDDWVWLPNEEFKDNILLLLAQGKLEEALEIVSSKVSDARLLLARFNGAKKQYEMGLIDFSEWARTQAQVGYSLLECAEQVKTMLPKKEYSMEPVIRLKKLVASEMKLLIKELLAIDHYVVELHEFDPLDPNKNLYGQLFEHCRSEEAVRILNRVTQPFSQTLQLFSPVEEGELFSMKIINASPLEFYLSVPDGRVSYVIDCINTGTFKRNKL